MTNAQLKESKIAKVRKYMYAHMTNLNGSRWKARRERQKTNFMHRKIEWINTLK